MQVEPEVHIKLNKVLLGLNEYVLEGRGLKKQSNTLYGFDGLEEFLDNKIIFNQEEVDEYPYDTSIIIEFIIDSDYTISDFRFVKPPLMRSLISEITNVMLSIEKVILEEEIDKRRRINFIYELKFPPQFMPEFKKRKLTK